MSVFDTALTVTSLSLEIYSRIMQTINPKLANNDEYDKEIKEAINHATNEFLIRYKNIFGETKDVNFLSSDINTRAIYTMIFDGDVDIEDIRYQIEGYGVDNNTTEDGIRNYIRILEEKIKEFPHLKHLADTCKIQRTTRNMLNHKEDLKHREETVIPLSEQINGLNSIFTQSPVNTRAKLIGRNNDIKKATQKLTEDGLVILNGLGGIGKTLIAKHIFFIVRGYDHIGWVNYNGRSMIRSIASALEGVSGIQFRKDSTDNERFELFESIINNCNKKVLLIIDNVDNTIQNDPTINEILRLKCDLLITSRHKLFEDKCQTIGLLSESGCLELFKRFYNLEDNDDLIIKIVKLAGWHTLSIELLAKTAQVSSSKLLIFYKKLKRSGFDLTDINESVTSGWDNEITRERLIIHLYKVFDMSKLCKEEVEQLGYIAMLGPEPVSKEILIDIFQINFNILNNLVQKGWLGDDGYNFHIHTIIRTIVEKKFEIDENSEIFNIIESSFIKLSHNNTSAFNDDDTFNVDDLIKKIDEMIIELEAEIQAFENKDIESIAIIYFKKILKRANKLYDEQKYNLAIGYFKIALFIIKRKTDNYIEITNTLIKIAELFLRMQNYERSFFYYSEVLINDKNNYSIDAVYNNMAIIYEHFGDYKNALEYYQLSLNKMNENKNPDIFTVYVNIAELYKKTKELSNAVKYYQLALFAIYLPLNNTNDKAVTFKKIKTNVGVIYNEIVKMYKNMGDDNEIQLLEFLLKFLKIKRESGKPDEIIKICSDIIESSWSLEDFDNALYYLQEILSLLVDDIGIGWIYNNMAIMYEGKNDLKNASRFYQLSLDKMIEQSDPEIYNVFFNIAEFYKVKEEYDVALNYFYLTFPALTFYKRNENNYKFNIFIKRYIDTNFLSYEIANIYMVKGEYDKAIKHFQTVLSSLKEKWGFYQGITLKIIETIKMTDRDDYKETLDFIWDLYNLLANLYIYKEEFDKALEFYNIAIDILKTIHGGEETLYIGVIQNNKGKLYIEKGEMDKAFKYSKLAEQTIEKAQCQNSIYMGFVYLNFSSISQSKGDYESALQYNRMALNIFNNRKLKERHPKYVIAYNNIAEVYMAMTDNEKALEYCRKALNICNISYYNEHPHLAMTYINMANIYIKKCDYELALDLVNKAYKIYVSKLGEDHSKTKKAFDIMQQITDMYR